MSYLVSTTDNLNIFHKRNLCYSEAYSFLLKQYAEAIDEGKVFSITPWNNDTCGLFYAKKDDKIIGVIVYDTDYNERKNNYILGIIFASIDKDYRNKGIYSKLYNQLEHWGKIEGFPVLGTLIHKNDSNFMACMKSKGFTHIMYKTIKYLDR